MRKKKQHGILACLTTCLVHATCLFFSVSLYNCLFMAFPLIVHFWESCVFLLSIIALSSSKNVVILGSHSYVFWAQVVKSKLSYFLINFFFLVRKQGEIGDKQMFWLLVTPQRTTPMGLGQDLGTQSWSPSTQTLSPSIHTLIGSWNCSGIRTQTQELCYGMPACQFQSFISFYIRISIEAYIQYMKILLRYRNGQWIAGKNI